MTARRHIVGFYCSWALLCALGCAFTSPCVVRRKSSLAVLDPRNDVLYNPYSYRVLVKPRGSRPRRDSSAGKWNALKRIVHGTASKIRSFNWRRRNSPEAAFVGVPSARIQSGYSSVERSVFMASPSDGGSSSPGERLMKEYRTRKTPPKRPEDDDKNIFDSVKEGIYSMKDAAKGLVDGKENNQKEILVRNMPPPLVSTETTLPKPSTIENALPKLKSQNPVQKFMAEQDIRQWEKERKLRRKALERDKALEEAKGSFYQLVDALRWAADFVTTIPSRVSESVEDSKKALASLSRWVQSIPESVDLFVKTVQSVPSRVEEKATQVQDSVESAVQTSKQVVEDVQAFPSRVRAKIEQTRKSVDRTLSGTVQTVDDAVTKVKVVAGVEKPKPQPPRKPPPMDSSNAEKVALNILGGIASGAFQVLWSIGKTVGQLAWNGVNSAMESNKKSKSSKPKSKPKSPTMPPSSKAKKSALDDEVASALELAEEALEMAGSQDPTTKGKKTTM